jgi:hypothetical protein
MASLRREQEQQANESGPLPFVLVFLLILVALGLWQRSQREGAASHASSTTELEKSVERVEEATRQLENDGRRNDQQARDLASSLSSFEAGRTTSAKLPADQFPTTNDYESSSSLDQAMLLAPGELLGWVSDLRGAPIADARLALHFQSGTLADGTTTPTLTANSDANGLFRFDAVPPGIWNATAEKVGYATAVTTGLLVEPASHQQPIELRLTEELKLAGKVVAAGQPIEGASIVVTRSISAVHEEGALGTFRLQYAEARSDSDGRFTLVGLPPGSVDVTAAATGYARFEQEAIISPQSKELMIELRGGTSLSGLLRDERGANIVDGELKLTLPGGSADLPLATVRSSRSGAWEFTDLPAATDFHLFAKAERYAAGGPFTLRSGSTTNLVVLTAGGTISGVVTDFDSGDPLPGIALRAICQDCPMEVDLTTRTNSDGAYQIARLPGGTYEVRLNSETLTSEPRGGLKLEAGANLQDVNFSAYPGLRLEGVVVDAETGLRLPYAQVEAHSRVGTDLLKSSKLRVIADATGAFAFHNVPQGIYRLHPALKGYMTGVGVEAEHRVELFRGRLAAPVELRLYPAGIIEGLVVDLAGMPVANALIQLLHEATSPGIIPELERFRTTTGTAGTFELTDLPLHDEVHLVVTAAGSGLPKARSEVIVLSRAEPHSRTTINLGYGQDLVVQVGTRDGIGLGEAAVQLQHAAFTDLPPPSWNRQTAPDGTTTFEAIPLGRVTAHVSCAGFLATTVEYDLVLDSPGLLEVALEPATSLAGRVVTDREEPCSGGSISALPGPNAKGTAFAPIGPDGAFRLDGLGNGLFTLDVVAQRPTATGTRNIPWAFPRVATNAGASLFTARVPMSAAIQGIVEQPDSRTKPAKYRIELTGTYSDSARWPRTITIAHSFEPGSRFLFDYLPPGEYRLTASAPDYLPQSVGPIKVQSQGVASAGTIVLRAGGTFISRAVSSTTGEPIRGALVTLQPGGPIGESSPDGVIDISPITPGIYTAHFSHPEYLPHAESLVPISRGKVSDIGEVALRPGAVLFGVVTNSLGAALAGITVEARAVEAAATVRRTHTDASGRYELQGLVPGGQVVTWSGTVRERPVTQSSQVIVSDAVKTELDVILDATANLSVTLGAPPSIDLNRAIVSLYPLNGVGVPIINQLIRPEPMEGAVHRVLRLAPGRYLVAVQAPRGAGRHYWSQTVRVAEGENRVSIYAGTLTLAGTVQGSRGGPGLAAQDLRLEHVSTPESGVRALRNWWLKSQKTADDGTFEFNLLPAGVYSFVAISKPLDREILEVITLTGDQPVTTENFSFPEPEKRLQGPLVRDRSGGYGGY